MKHIQLHSSPALPGNLSALRLALSLGATLAALGLFALLIMTGFSGCAVTGPLTSGEVLDNSAPDTSDFGLLADGIRTATGSAAVTAGSVAVFREVTVTALVSGGALVSLTLDSPAELAEDPRFMALGEAILLQQNLDVDVVSGGTFSRCAYLKAVDKAVRP